MNLKETIQALAQEIHKDIVEIRRVIHAHPELSFKEYKTSEYISGLLNKYGIEHQTGIAETGIVALIKGKNASSKTIALRADIDALPILEKNEVPYKSKNEGIMHACGHDVHSASLLGTAIILEKTKEHWSGTVKLLFQPGEEQLPGGASLMIKAGVLENPKPSTILGQHVHPPLEAGKVGFKAGNYMASADEIQLKVIGMGGHGALPQNCVDPVVITAHIITALQTLVSRNSNPITPSVLTFGKMNTEGGNFNVIPNAVNLLGTFRTMDEKWRMDAHDKIRRIAESTAMALGGKCEVNINKGYPFLTNDEATTHKSIAAAKTYLGEENVVDLPIRMTAEDFAYYSQEMPACFYRLGTGNLEKGITSSVHTDTFDIDEKALETGSGLMAWLAINALQA